MHNLDYKLEATSLSRRPSVGLPGAGMFCTNVRLSPPEQASLWSLQISTGQNTRCMQEDAADILQESSICIQDVRGWRTTTLKPSVGSKVNGSAKRTQPLPASVLAVQLLRAGGRLPSLTVSTLMRSR